nr:MAG: RNA-dependent RNA polymerase [Riboviria sp.]
MVSIHYFGTNKSVKQLQEYCSDVGDWIDKVSALYVNDGKTKCALELGLAYEVRDLMAQGNQYFKNLTDARAPPPLVNYFRNSYNQCKEMFDSASSLINNNVLRNAPLVVHFFGASGLGKSTLCNFVVSDLASHAGIEQHNDLMYVRKPDNTFWDSYRNQFAVLYDDIFQLEDTTKRGPMALEVIDCSNTIPYPLTMADLSCKGKSYFMSKVILMTSNEDQARDIGIATPLAFWRRRNLTFKVLPNPKYSYSANGKLMVDRSLVKRLTGMALHWDVYSFQQCDNVTSAPTGGILNYEEMSALLIESYDRTQCDSQELQRALSAKREQFFDCRAQGGFDGLLQSAPTSEEFLSLCCEWYQFIREKIFAHPYLTAALSALALLAGFLGLWKFWSSHTYKAENHSGDDYTKRFKRNVKVAENHSGDPYTKRFNKNVRVAESCEDITAWKYAQGNLWRNCCRIQALHCGMENPVGMNIIMIKDTIGVVPKHLLLSSETIVKIILYTHNNYFEFVLDDLVIHKHDTLDICMIKFPRQVPRFSDISKQFIHDSDLNTHQVHSGLLLLRDFGAKQIHTTDVGNVKLAGQISYGTDIQGKEYQLLNAQTWEYTACTQPGSCGSPFICFNNKLNRKIGGFHIAGCTNTNFGCSTLLTTSILEKLLNKFDGILTIEAPKCDDVEFHGLMLGAQGCFDALGSVLKGVHLPTKTQIVPSPIFDQIVVHTTKPAYLTKTRGIHPMQKAVVKYFGSEQKLDQKCVDMIVKDISLKLQSLPKYNCRRLTIQESLNGIEGERYIKPIDLNTSPGYPYILDKTLTKGKRSFVEVIDGIAYPKEKLLTNINNRSQNLNAGVVVPTLWTDNLKDERRPIEKVEQLKTRSFVAAPFDYTILFRQYFMGFVDHIERHHDVLECKVGINPHGYGWTILAKYLDAFDNNKFIAGDFSNFDGSLPRQVMLGVLDIVKDWYGHEFDIQHEGLFESVISAMHICGSDLYRVYHGNPSGNPFTAVMNSLCNSILIRYAFLKGCANGYDLSDFDKYIRVAVYGDDNVIAVAEPCSWFNGSLITEQFEHMGLTYTNCTKTGVNTDFDRFQDISFLKRKFVKFDNNRYLAPLERQSINEMLNWCRGDFGDWNALYANITSALDEMFHYGETMYNAFVEDVNMVLIKHHQLPLNQTYYKLLMRWLSDALSNGWT